MSAVQPAANGHPGYNVTRAASPAVVEEARRLARQAMHLWGFGPQAETAALLISELATNAITHTPSRHVRVIVDRPTPTRVRLAVVDKTPHRTPELCPADVDGEAESGRGLRLVDALADGWGYDLLGSHKRGPWGKRCWAELAVGGAR
ncbi:ATP-binding protein [Streptomyces sp. NPDC047049]|uniref:ATP-binding protein n=1 Tax=Streptomyces sp. NPDC047049 TaxID=3156688 RepID=UPI0033F6BA32